jgi:hypothetical protein
MSDRFLQLEKTLLSAVTGRRYPEVEKFAAQFCAQAAEEWRAFPYGDPRARHIFDRLQSVLEWARLMVSTSRAAQADKLRRVRLTSRYLVRNSTTGNHLRFDI